jgi:molybdopterin synthase sulfur carrier subunit
MTVAIRIPTPLRTFSKGRDLVQVEAKSLREMLRGLESECPGIASRILDDKGDVRRFVNLFVNDTDIRTLAGLESPVKDGDVVSIVPAIAGGMALTAQELMSQLRQEVTEVTPAAVNAQRKEDTGVLLIDVRLKPLHITQSLFPGPHPAKDAGD